MIIKKLIILKDYCKQALPYELRTSITSKLFLKYVTSDEEDFSNNLYLNMNDLMSMKNYGMEIGSHGYDHFWLENINENQQKIDIKKSLDFLIISTTIKIN